MNSRDLLTKWPPIMVTVIAFLVGLRAEDPLKAILEVVSPPSGRVGGLAMPLLVVPAGEERTTSDALLLIRHAAVEQTTLHILAAGITPQRVLGGATCAPPPRMVPQKEATGGSSRILDVDLPPRTTLALVVTAPGQMQPSRTFAIEHEALRKEFATPDLEVRTRSERTASTALYVGLSLVAACLGHAIGRMPRLTFPSTQTLPRTRR